MALPTELDLLKERATTMGIGFHPNIGTEKLREKIEAMLVPTSLTTDKVLGRETIAERNARLRKEAMRMIRISLTCMNPAKSTWNGEFISVGNSSIGFIKKFIPFEAEEGWHIPAVFLEVLKERKYQSFYTTNINGHKVKKGKLVKEFAIEVLPNLSVDELKTLAAKQALKNSDEG